MNSTYLSFDTLRQSVRAHASSLSRAWYRLRSQNLQQQSLLDRVTPLRRDFGWTYGKPIDRYYIESFLASHAADIQGNVLEFQDSTYTYRFGGQAVLRSDVLHREPGNSKATIVADITSDDPLPRDAYDCIVCTQTLMFTYDVKRALCRLREMLRPGGVVLATLAGISQICREEMSAGGDYWRFTSLSARRLFEEVFRPGQVEVCAFGNVLAAVAFLHGLLVEEVSTTDLEQCDPDYELIIAARAVRAD